ncbi:hypothetical protein AJ85_17575 [Alkalihalobacillus alcalophilus ATCC 27647 = CGMCC 1.3604]|uniref:Pilus assembly protein TadE n=1 Tax=Alkalihalobacillus alcalophilus ATCC 27647 = CGMCC 1.3604 TaxID=1218173 RepID=A0A4S4K0L0_ALKAL|nr:TadE/TadG family type IV pilus assembly protein [Alkalihalobacillus alcalophilus]MED1561339.1 pilus assembly protein [Alkalihalobacillus alcalophilus]THG89479.1 hypothetical protein AJ85_17575 [Alkalihalobacillus alcalophilus ATCC 27647 = CGMCC 1.3604]
MAELIHKRLKRFKDDQSGVFTIEASMLFPIILIITMCLIFFSLFIYQKSVVQYQANKIADQVASSWTNSQMDPKTGEFSTYTTFDGGDGLYWRTAEASFLDFLNIPSVGTNRAADKLRPELEDAALGNVTVEMKPQLFGFNAIVVTVEQPLSFPSYVTDLFGVTEIKAQSQRPITEPVEWIRNVDFAVYFYGKIGEFGSYIEKIGSNKN